MRIFAFTGLFVALSGLCPATLVDLTSADAQAVVNGAIFRQFDFVSTGSGNFNTFLSLRKTGVEQGYNTGNKNKEFDTQNARSLQLSEIPVITINGIEYREFGLDINQTTGNPKLSVDDLRLYIANAPDLRGYPGLGTKVYDLDASGDSAIVLDYNLNGGSGSGDMVMLIPSLVFGTNNNQYVYLYSKMGVLYNGADDGFEEWGIAESGTIIPEPASIIILVAGSVSLAFGRKKHSI